MPDDVKDRIFALLDSIRADFPRCKQAAEALMRQHGLMRTLDMVVEPPASVQSVPTFKPGYSRELSPMLRARFEYCASLKLGQDTWLSADEMAFHVQDEKKLLHHRARREYWEGSAPMLFPDEQLALFASTEGVPQDAIYLVWARDSEEPEVWTYEGQESEESANFEEFLSWMLTRP